VKDCGVAVVRLPGRSWAPNSSNGDEVNVGTARGCPPLSGLQSGRWAGSSSAEGHGWGGGPGVVAGVTTRHGGRESRSQGQGGQQVEQ
jgi:hypothetical protein